MKFNQLQTCPVCGEETAVLFSSGAVPVGCCMVCHDRAQTRAIEACNPRETNELQKRGVTTETVRAAIKEVVR